MTRDEICKRLHALSNEMMELGVAIDYYGGICTPEITKRGREMIRYGSFVVELAYEIQSEKENG